jgi:hypothetical protein
VAGWRGKLGRFGLLGPKGLRVRAGQLRPCGLAKKKDWCCSCWAGLDGEGKKEKRFWGFWDLGKAPNKMEIQI